MKIIKSLTLGAILLFAGVFTSSILYSQSKEFELGRNLEIQYNIIKQLQHKYVDTINAEKLLTAGINAMLESLDPYTEYLPEDDNEDVYEMIRSASYGGIGSLIKKVDSLGVVISQPYLNSPAQKYGLEPGDIILEIDGTSVTPLSADECSKRMKGQPGTDVKFLVKKARGGEEKEIIITRERVHIPDVSYSGILNDTIGYIKIDGFTDNGWKDVRNSVFKLKEEGAKRLILDFRGNGGGIMEEAVNIVSLFVPKGTLVVSAKGRVEGSSFTYKTENEPIDTLIPLMIMVNSGSASSSEIVAGAIQDLDRGVIMGTKTFGKGLVQSFAPTGYNGKIKLTTSRYYTPSGRCVQAIDYSSKNSDGVVADSLKKAYKTKLGRTVYDGGGITPDVEVKTTQYSRPALSLVMNDILGDYANIYYAKNNNIANPKAFSLTESEYNN